MKLFVDDIRACPEGWVLARTITEAIRLLSTQDVTHVSLDHDIGCRLASGQEHSSDETFEPVAWYLAKVYDHPAWGGPVILIHTGNIEAGKRMAEIMGIQDYSPAQIFDPENYK